METTLSADIGDSSSEKSQRLQGRNEGITLGPRAGAETMLKISRPRVRLHHPMKKFAENRPGDTRARADQALSHSLNTDIVI
jgi:hypothetical protein